MGRHEAPEPIRPLRQRLLRHAMHPLTHLLTLLSLHIAALTVIDKTPLLTLLLLH